jgi:ABC-type amino acid transport system permease subunit
MDTRRFIFRETMISVAINTVLSIGFFLLIFGHTDRVPLWGMGNWVFDAIPQSFMIALMGTLVPGLIASKALRTGKIAVKGVPRPFSRLAMRALVTALIAAAAGYASAGVVAELSGLERFGWTAALAIKAAYGAALAAIVTPLSLRAALAAGQG